jgi:hypothetical protein
MNVLIATSAKCFGVMSDACIGSPAVLVTADGRTCVIRNTLRTAGSTYFVKGSKLQMECMLTISRSFCSNQPNRRSEKTMSILVKRRRFRRQPVVAPEIDILRMIQSAEAFMPRLKKNALLQISLLPHVRD